MLEFHGIYPSPLTILSSFFFSIFFLLFGILLDLEDDSAHDKRNLVTEVFDKVAEFGKNLFRRGKDLVSRVFGGDQESFQRLFAFDESERLHDHFRCSFVKGIHRAGVLYLSDHYLCFDSRLFRYVCFSSK